MEGTLKTSTVGNAQRHNVPLYTFDMTIWHDQCSDRGQLLKFLREHCKKWAYQLEQNGDDGKLHWQCRVSLIKKKRKSEFLAVLPFPHSSVSPSSSSVHEGQNFNYTMKADTRVEGPWTDKDDLE